MNRCQACSKDFTTASSLKRHNRTTHPNELDGSRQTNKTHSCPCCHQTFPRRDTLKRHVRNIHDGGLSLCSICMKEHRADYMSRHRSICAKRYLKWLQQHSDSDYNASTAHSKSAPRSIQLGSRVPPEFITVHLSGNDPSTPQPQGPTLRSVHEHVFDAGLTGDALTCALSTFQETKDIEAYEQALAAAFRLNITFDGQSIRHGQNNWRFRKLTKLVLMIDEMNRGQASIHATDMYDRTILHHACGAGVAVLLEPLFWRGACFDAVDIEGKLPLIRAVHSGDLDTVLFALALGADPRSGYPFATASITDQRDIMVMLVEYGADVNETFNGITALGRAIFREDLDGVRFVLSLGADANLAFYNEHRPMSFVIMACGHQGSDGCFHEQIASSLIEHGFDLSSQDQYGHTVFHLAVRKTWVRLLRAALSRITSTDILSVSDTDGRTAVHYAALELEKSCARREPTMLSILLDAGADINAPNDGGESALNVAARGGCEMLVKLLIDAGADVDSQDKHGYSALITAAKYGRIKMVRLLLDAGANVYTRTVLEESAFIFAARNGHEEIVRLLTIVLEQALMLKPRGAQQHCRLLL